MADETTITIQADDAEEAFFATVHMLRGSIIMNFSHAEFLFADLYYRALCLPEYAHLSNAFPYTVKARIKNLKILFSLPGPLQKFEAEVLQFIDRLREFEQLRQYFAHGLLVIYPKPDGIARISFRAYSKSKRSGPILGEMSGSLEVLYSEDKKSANMTIL